MWRRRAAPLGLLLTAVPIAFTLFPPLAETPLYVRVLVASVWIPGALLLRRAGDRRDAQLDDLLEPPLERRGLQRSLAGARLIPALLAAAPFPSHYVFRLYLLDADLGRLLPSYETEPEHPLTSWEIGRGVTGRAWRSGEYESARGSAVSDDTYGLDPEQQEQYRRLQVVAAMPVRSAREHVIAVLTGSSEIDDGYLLSPAGKDAHAELADVIARILIDILRLTSD